MNPKILLRYWRTILVVAEMTIRQQMTDMFVIFAVLFQPIIIAALALWMLIDKGSDYAMFVVVGSGLTGLWSSLLFVSGNSINAARLLVGGSGMAEVSSLLWGELGIGLLYGLLGYFMFAWFEVQAKQRGTLEVF